MAPSAWRPAEAARTLPRRDLAGIFGHVMRGFTSCLLLFVALSAASGAEAQRTNYQEILVGDRSSGLGTAFTGLANDASAIYYNAAGLLQQEHATVTGGLYLQAFQTMYIENGVTTDYGVYDIDDNSRPTFPAFAASTINLGPRDDQGRRPYVIGITSFRLRNVDNRVEEAFLNPETGLEDTFEVQARDRTTYYGLSFSSRFGERWSGGVALFLSEQKLRHQQDIVQVTGPAPFALSNSQLTLVDVTLRTKSYYALLRLGGLFRLNERWQFGGMLQLPGIRIKSQTDFDRQFARYDLTNPGDTIYVYAEDDDVQTHFPIPLELRLGLAYRHSDAYLFTADVSFVSPVRDRETFDIEDIPGAPAQSVYYPSSTQRRAVVNLSAGFEWRVAQILMLQFGAYTNFSSAMPIDEPTNQFTPSDIDTFGLSLGAVLHNNGRGLAVGVVTELGRGSALGYNIFPDVAAGETVYYPTDARRKVIYLSITGATQVLEDVSRVAVTAVRPSAAPGGPSEDPTLFNIRSTHQRELVTALLMDPSSRTAFEHVKEQGALAGRRAFETLRRAPSARTPESVTTPEPTPELAPGPAPQRVPAPAPESAPRPAAEAGP